MKLVSAKGLKLTLAAVVCLGALGLLGSCCLTSAAGESSTLGDMFSMGFLMTHTPTATPTRTVSTNDDAEASPLHDWKFTVKGSNPPPNCT